MSRPAMSRSALSRSPFSSPSLFFLLVFGWTWLFWGLAVVSGTNVATATGRTLLFLGLGGPMLGGLLFGGMAQDLADRRDYWRRIVDVRRIQAGWYAVIFLFPPSLLAAAILLDVAAGGTAQPLRTTIAAFVAAPSTIVPVLFLTFLQGPLPEELGWRGYVLDRLQARWTALAASLILGAVWALWHLPLFFINGMLHAERGVGSAWFWLFMVQTVCAAVLYTWIFNHTRRSTLAAVLFHFVTNLAYVIIQPADRTNLYATALWIASAAAAAPVLGRSGVAKK